MPECDNCGGHVSDDFYRVFSDPDSGEIYACPDEDCDNVASAYNTDP